MPAWLIRWSVENRLLVLIAALMPAAVWFWSDDVPVVEWLKHVDKWAHGLTFVVLTVWFCGQYPRGNYWRVAIGLVAMTLIIFKQYRFMVNKDLGIDKENLLVIRRPDGLKDQLEAYKEKVIQYEGVVSFTNSTFIPGNDAFPRIPFYIEGEDATRNYSLDYIFVSEEFAETYGIQNAKGRFFNDRPAIL